MWILLSAVATASLMGSLHCVGMCGPLALWAAGADSQRRGTGIWLSTTLYHAGRGFTYAIAGLIAGSVGQLIDWSGGAIGVQLLAARVVGSLMILIGLYSLFRLVQPWLLQRYFKKAATNASEKAVAVPLTPPKPNWITSQILRIRPLVFKLPIALRGLTVGLLTALLPCGWLYIFALLAAGTGSAKLGALVMLAFWLGSVPLLVGLVVGTRLLSGRVARLVPYAAALLMVVAGTYTASGRGFASLSQELKVSSVLLDQLKDGSSAEELDSSTIEAGIEQLVATPLPCCQNRKAAATASAAEQNISGSAGAKEEP